MTSALHITNGDSAANLIRESGVAGEVLPWRDPMHHGPCPSGHSLEELSRLRIHYLSDGTEGGSDSTKHGFTERDATLARGTEFDEVILWFEHDLLDQLQILQLLDWFTETGNGFDNVSMICIDQFEGVDNFRGLGQLSPGQLATLYPQRQSVTAKQIEAAGSCWRAFRHSDPTRLPDVLKSGIPELPFMQAALYRHCQEFPWLEDGLTRTERQILKLVKEGVTSPNEIFVRNMEFETSLYIGDARTFSVIEQLCNAPTPFLQCTGGEVFKHPYHGDISRDEFRKLELLIADEGQRVLAGGAEPGRFLPRDEWLGGVHLQSPDSIWRWNNAQKSFVSSSKPNS